MADRAVVLVTLALLGYASGSAHSECGGVLARTEAGWVCGQERAAENGARYASFRGIPYAKQPLGELRFKELQPAEPWEGVLDARAEGPACHQHNVLWGPLLTPRGLSEACVTANVHVPAAALPCPGQVPTSGGLPVIVFYHGGGWISGSGDADINGPEYLVGKDVVVITFNYRLDLLGFLSLGTAKVPGNNGLRDAITLLRWVQRNARRFGGNPDEVTLAGESAGATNAHLLSLSPLSKGLFKRLWLMSGLAIPRNHVTAPAYAQRMATIFLETLGLNGTDYDTVHDRLVQLPIETLFNASSALLPLGITSFQAVQESPLPGVTAIVPDDPERLLANGAGDDIPVVIGFNSNECQFFRPRLTALNLLEAIKANPVNALPTQLLFTLSENVSAAAAANLFQKYITGELTLEKFMPLCTDMYFKESTLRFVRERAARGGAPVYLYKFSYEAEHSVVKQVFNLTYSGAAHTEDLNHIFKVNSNPVPPTTADNDMKDWMSDLVVNFVKTGAPTRNNSWPPQAGGQPMKYLEFITPYTYLYTEMTDAEYELENLFTF